MCEDAGCDGHHEQISPELMENVRERIALQAKQRGMTLDEFLDADNLVGSVNRARSWFESLWVNMRLLKPGF